MKSAFGYYPGCSLEGSAREFDMSLRAVLEKLDMKIEEVKDWSCCGASSAHVSDHLLAAALPGRNLMLAKEQGLANVVAPCAACYNRLAGAKHELQHNAKVKADVEELMGKRFTNGIEILNIIQLFEAIGAEKIKAAIQEQLGHLKAACYYGCLLVRPHGITNFDDMERPVSMEKIVEAAGAKTVSWNFKTECCGAAHSIAHTDVVEVLSKRIIDDAIKNGANVIVVACPMCHSNLDMRQLNIKKHFENHQDIPVVYLTELVGMALGIKPEALGLNLHFIDTKSLLVKEGAV